MADLIRDRVRYEVQDAIARITLARPDAGNGLDLAMAEAIRDAAERVRKSAETGELRAVLLQAEGRVFCVDEAASISTLVATTDGREGVDAFLGKRNPDFAG